MSGIAEYHAELHSKQYRYMKPGLENGDSADTREMSVMDPFGNRITFVEQQGAQEHNDQGICIQESVS